MIKKITFDTYPIKLYIFINETDEGIMAYMDKEDTPELVEDILNFDEGDEALFAYKDTTNIAIRLRDLQKPEFVTHEAFHATCYIMRYVGIRLTKSSEEAYAYLLQYITENIFD
jgi:hypothetical protein